MARTNRTGLAVRLAGVIFALATSITQVEGGLQQTNRLLVTSTQESNDLGVVTRRYWVDWARLPLQVSWRLGHSFPIRLDVGLSNATSFLLHKSTVTNRLGLVSVGIFPLIPEFHEMRAHGKSPAEFMDQWCVRYILLELAQPATSRQGASVRFHDVVMLLDGTFADEETVRAGGRVPDPEPRGSQNPISGDFAGSVHPGVSEWYAELKRPDFKTPQVSWNPVEEPFPLDLNAQAMRIREYLVREFGASQRLQLVNGSVDSYLPFEVMGENPFSNQRQWLLVFMFLDRSPSASTAVYEAAILLDGRVLAVHKK